MEKRTETMECNYCDREFTYALHSNFIVFCPECKRQTMLECEYGYGPVTPCHIEVGEETVGIVTCNDKHEYYLELDRGWKKIKLKESYLNALQEASRMMGQDLTPKRKNRELDSLKIKKEGGSLCIYGEWDGRPYDNYHKIKAFSCANDVLEIHFTDHAEKLLVIHPTGITNTSEEFSIQHAQKVKWYWLFYDGKKTEYKKMVYEPRKSESPAVLMK